MISTDIETEDLLSDDQARLFAATRHALKELKDHIEEASYKEGADKWDLGKTAEAIYAAEGAIFNVLNIMNSHLHSKTARRWIHERKPL